MTGTGFVNLLEWMSDTIDPDVQLTTLRTFIFIATRGTCTQKEVEMHLKTTNGSASRNVSYWTDLKFDRSKGMGFVQRVEDQTDRRMKSLSLTKKGQAFYDKLREKM
jgi:DNA-binding MarR family transcriptional regulator